MKNGLADLNNHLFAQIEALDNDELSSDEAARLIEKSKVMIGLAGQILNVAKTQIDAMKLKEACGLTDDDMPELIQNKDCRRALDAQAAAKRRLIGGCI